MKHTKLKPEEAIQKMHDIIDNSEAMLLMHFQKDGHAGYLSTGVSSAHLQNLMSIFNRFIDRKMTALVDGFTTMYTAGSMMGETTPLLSEAVLELSCMLDLAPREDESNVDLIGAVDKVFSLCTKLEALTQPLVISTIGEPDETETPDDVDGSVPDAGTIDTGSAGNDTSGVRMDTPDDRESSGTLPLPTED